MKPVYIINGFLESGKTEFIAYTLEQPYFQIKGKTLLILCEEGEVEYEEELLEGTQTVLELIEDEEEFTPAYLIELEKKHRPERIIIEYNGMWNYKEIKLPWHWAVEQQVTTIDGTTFAMYFNNMKSLLAEMVRKSELIIFNRCDGLEDLSSYKRSIKAINPKAEIVFEDTNGEIDELLEEELPYNLQAETIELDHIGYGIWYLDCLDHLERYLGKKVAFKAMVMKPDEFPKGYFVPGRLAMTCCADDMAFLGFACAYKEAEKLEDGQWVKVTARMKKEYFADYGGEGPILEAVSVEKTKAPKEEIISFV
ncbi:MAG: GTPase [Lachnospiraceae bacterium]|nr:GTPase [Lachnospiraceae bacterium]